MRTQHRRFSAKHSFHLATNNNSSLVNHQRGKILKANEINSNRMNSTSESSVRRRAKTRGLTLQKSRSRCKEWPGYGTFRVAKNNTNTVAFGGGHDTFGASLEQCARY